MKLSAALLQLAKLHFLLKHTQQLLPSSKWARSRTHFSADSPELSSCPAETNGAQLLSTQNPGDRGEQAKG